MFVISNFVTNFLPAGVPIFVKHFHQISPNANYLASQFKKYVDYHLFTNLY